MKKLFPRSLAGQLIALTLAAVAIAQIISLIVFWDDRRVAIRAAIREQVFERTISIVRLLQETHPSQHAALLRAGGTGRLFFSLDPDSIVPLEDAVRANSKMNRRLAHALGVAPSEIRMSPEELAPTSDRQRNWPLWGLFFKSGGKKGEAPQLVSTLELLRGLESWRLAEDDAARRAAWSAMLEIHADQVFSIGIVGQVMDLGSVEAIKELVGAGLGCAVLPGTAVRNPGDRTPIVSRPLSPKLHRKLALVMRRDKIRTKALRETLKALKTLA